ncbi:ATPase [Corallococcus coralloides DSM 2259]|uniref:ATPase n=1 Tax=Corallococcus coralloides (strain ATCC 25202 / DSM 2259 / NBRC 100086 / M2) TaxID=1144275 RepID=H8MU96_CORCM|nr:AAA family ATPase [Corallococcus coralloides]AFE06259.1 ATPase [Corallococcus coralloides DSM 2259]
MKKLTSIQVTNLFGYLNHEINLEEERGITILHGANGTGKTTILRAIEQLSRSIPQFLMNVNFKNIKLSFHDKSSMVVRKDDKQLTIDLYQGGKQTNTVNTKSIYPKHGFDLLPRYIHEIETANTQTTIWQATPSADAGIWALEEDPYNLELSRIVSRQSTNIPPWLTLFWKNFECTLIEEQRLLRIIEERKRGRPLFKRVVEDYADALRAKFKDALSAYAEHSQQLDRTFPRRVIEALESAPPPPDALTARLERIEKRRQELHSAGLIEKETALTWFDYQKLSRGEVATTLSVYAADTESKLNKFDEIHKKITTFENLINSHLTHKTARLSKDSGLEFTISNTGAKLDPASLSSGEQHMLVLFFELIFGRFQPGHLVLIDEPELSLHPAWQLRFIDDLEKVRSINKVDFILATHSPQIIGNKWSLTRELSV